jgi:hypothetical protein
MGDKSIPKAVGMLRDHVSLLLKSFPFSAWILQTCLSSWDPLPWELGSPWPVLHPFS